MTGDMLPQGLSFTLKIDDGGFPACLAGGRFRRPPDVNAESAIVPARMSGREPLVLRGAGNGIKQVLMRIA
jgi:hypothetical protein